MSPNPLISVVIPTYNREEILCKTISGLLEQTYPNFEILVIDQTKKHEARTEDFLKDLHNKNKIRLIKLSQAGVPGARNAGIKAAKGEIIVFNDDDVIPSKDLIQNYYQSFKNPKIVAIAAKILNEPKKTFINADKCKDPIKNWWYFNFDSDQRLETANAAGSSMGYRKKVLLEIGGFDTNYINDSWGEEADVGFRLRKKGYKINYEPSVVVTHHQHPTGGSRSKNTDVSMNLSFYRNLVYFFLKNLNFLQILIHMIIDYRYFVCREKEEFLKNPQALKRFFQRNLKYFFGFFWGCGVYIKYLVGNRGQLESPAHGG